MSSSPARASSRRRRTARRATAQALGLALAALAALAALPAGAKVFATQHQALAEAFPNADRIEENTYVLSAERKKEVEALARAPLASSLVTVQTAHRGALVLGYAHIDVHTVRTKPEAILVVLSPHGALKDVRVLAFHEPLDYLPTKRWYERLVGVDTTGPLRIGRDVDAVSGATLSARAATASVRRMLAYHRLLLRPASEAE